MKEKAYIVANKEQELEVLKEFEDEGLFWICGEKPTEWLTSQKEMEFDFPYVLIKEDHIITWEYLEELTDETIMYDGRKEEKMKKYLVTQEFMNELIKWRDNEHIKPTSDGVNSYVSLTDLKNLPDIIHNWWVWRSNNPLENNNRLIAIIQWLNGEDVFEVEEPHKFVVRSEIPNVDGDYVYVLGEYAVTDAVYSLNDATKFNTEREAQEWANSHQVVVEVDEDGNEVK